MIASAIDFSVVGGNHRGAKAILGRESSLSPYLAGKCCSKQLDNPSIVGSMPYVSRRLLVSGKRPEKPIQDTEAPNLGRVVVVVAEPGGGKTAFAKALRDSRGAQYFTASGFALLDSTTSEIANDDW